jgi:thioredoxin-related protein
MMTAAVYWRESWEAALKEAKEQNHPLVLELYMETCPHCQRLHRETHADQAVAAALNTRFIPVRLEGRSHMDLVKEYNVTGAPTTLIFSAAGQELHRFAGFHAPAEYLQELEKFG